MTPAVAHSLRDLSTGAGLHALLAELYPLCRSITGDGLRRTLRLVAGELPGLELHEVATGTRMFDWEVPKEWNIREAYIEDPSGRRIVDFRDHSLHVVGYSAPVSARMSLSELRPHLHSLPEHPDWIPFRTSYFGETWGFCLTDRQYRSLPDGEYRVCIDSSLEPGHLTYGELFVPGDSDREIVVSCHCCHPSMCNDNLSGIVVAAALARAVQATRNRYSYRFLFVPATFGSLAWLARNEGRLDRIAGGLVLACIGDPGGFTYKQTRRGDTPIDRAARHVLRHQGRPFTIAPFVPTGYDERQYCSPGFDLPIGSLLRTPNGMFPQYHTSADDASFVTPDGLADSVACARAIIEVLEEDRVYVNLQPKGEPRLGRYELYPPMGDPAGPGDALLARLWVLNLSDGQHSLLQIAERAGLPFGLVAREAAAVAAAGLLREIGSSPGGAR